LRRKVELCIVDLNRLQDHSVRETCFDQPDHIIVGQLFPDSVRPRESGGLPWP
jgi:hypothetical protein